MINEVRNTVLSVLNKNNYGYISPSDFNLYATNAQMDLFESYFNDYNKAINMENARASGTDYADTKSQIAETLETFLVTNLLHNNFGNNFSSPSLTTTGDVSYYNLKMSIYPSVINKGTNTSISANELVDFTGQFTNLGISIGDIVVNITTKKSALVSAILSNTVILLDSDIFLVLNQDFAVISSKNKQAEKVSVGKISMLNNSLLTKPSKIFPAYTLEGNSIKVYPSTINTFGQVECVYFRPPKPPKWTYISIFSGEPVFDQSQADYQDFELPIEDIYKLVARILLYCGVSIRESEISSFAIGQEAKQNQQ